MSFDTKSTLAFGDDARKADAIWPVISDRPRDALCLPTIGGAMIRQESRDESVQQNGED
jgi:hypothetical protein